MNKETNSKMDNSLDNLGGGDESVTGHLCYHVGPETGLLKLLFIPRFEHFGSDNKRTVINKFVSSICWTGIEFAILVEGKIFFVIFFSSLHESRF